MKKQKILIAFLAFLAIVLGSILLVHIQKERSEKLPFTIGSPVMPMAEQMSMGMTQKEFVVPASEAAPTVDFTIAKDSTGDGWTVHATTTNFQFTPEHLGLAPIPGEGHMHLYIDGDLIVMLAPWYHIDALSKGTHTIQISLNNNDHSVYTANGAEIEMTKTIIVP